MIRKAFLLIGLFIVLAIVGGYRVYEHHLSIGVREALQEAADPAHSASESKTYLHDAMGLVKTEKDAEMVKKMQLAISLVEQHDRQQYQVGYDSVNPEVPANTLMAEKDKAAQSLHDAKLAYKDLREELGLPPVAWLEK
jgi:hypothetical protein